LTPLQQAIKREFPEAGESQLWLCSFMLNAMRAQELKEYVPDADMQKIAREAYTASLTGGDTSDGGEVATGIKIEKNAFHYMKGIDG